MESQMLHGADDYYNMGVVKYFYKCYHEAVEYFSMAIKLEPNDADIYFSRGVTNLNLNQKHEALMDLLKAIELGENVPQKLIDECD